MSDIEVHGEINGVTERIGTMHLIDGPRGQSVSFEYAGAWIGNDKAFSLEPALQLTRGRFYPQADRAMFGSLGDSAPDTWGRQLMQRSERRRANAEGRVPRTLRETDFLLGVSDFARLGAMRFKCGGDDAFQTPLAKGVPGLVHLAELLGVTERILRDEETDEDLLMIFAPGSSLGGARPKASVVDTAGALSIAKFPKESDAYSIELWESVALTLAGEAGITVAEHRLEEVANKQVLISKRFDRMGERRVPFLSAMSMLALKDGERASYPDLVEALTHNGANTKADVRQLYRRMIFNILISNVDDHLRNHGFLWSGNIGWTLSPAYDLNPVPVDLKPRILTTAIDGDDGTCDLDLAWEVGPYFNMDVKQARQISREVATAVDHWAATAKSKGATAKQIERMETAFEHSDKAKALAA
ncbi:type II toxin-antitoxin system HipA family toxin [Asticcacaulis sp. MM231]|uniref:type II toxin-antitoxin system HipA family toxin n=1 Tax=Asticcacaulis sp. MM231 TaxID=3157666 RepID=UPI0032D5905C